MKLDSQCVRTHWIRGFMAFRRLTERAGLDAIQDRLAQPGPDLGSLVSDVRARLELTDDLWAGG